MKKSAWLLVLFLSVATAHAQSGVQPRELYSRVMQAMNDVRTCSFVLDIHERVHGEMKYDQFVVKLNVDPYKVYVYSVTPNPGAEALLLDGVNDNKALINPNHWLIPTLSLSPYGSTLRKNHQYTLWHFGFSYISEVLDGYRKKHGAAFFNLLKQEGTVNWNGRPHFKIIIDNADFGFVNYTVRAGETLVEIGRQLLVNDFMILEANRQVRHFSDVREGQVIRVPNSFGKKIVFYIDPSNYLPMVQIVYDDQGLYSRMELTSLIVNPALTPEDFSRDNEKYGF